MHYGLARLTTLSRFQNSNNKHTLQHRLYHFAKRTFSYCVLIVTGLLLPLYATAQQVDSIKEAASDSIALERPKTRATQSKEQPASLIDKRVASEQALEDMPYVLTPHKVNYLFPITYDNSPNMDPYKDLAEGTPYTIDKFETKFQISFKLPLWQNMFEIAGKPNGQLFFAYTNQSYWQVFNKDISSPFRETNHEPEAFILFTNDWQLGPLVNSFWAVGAVHQSNGKSSALSRSWNRIYGTMIFDGGPMAFELKAWWRIPEDEKQTPQSAQGDDNPDILDYMGNVQITGVYGVDDHRFSFMARNLLQRPNQGAIALTWSYPIIGNLRIYSQYFNGYGESLIDYNSHNQRFSIGFALNDIL